MSEAWDQSWLRVPPAGQTEQPGASCLSNGLLFDQGPQLLLCVDVLNLWV